MELSKAATVTDPELVKAFNEGRGIESTAAPEDNSTKRYYVLFKNRVGELRKAEFPLSGLQEMLSHVALFFSTGATAVVISVYEAAPDGWDDFEEWTPISASDD